MAHYLLKAGAATRGRKRVKKIGMGSGKYLTQRARKRRRASKRRSASAGT